MTFYARLWVKDEQGIILAPQDTQTIIIEDDEQSIVAAQQSVFCLLDTLVPPDKRVETSVRFFYNQFGNAL